MVVGLDEAGYGPNLGPLIIAATVWEVPESTTEEQLCEQFGHGFCAVGWTPDCPHVPLGDSKRLYQPGGGLASLEAGLLAFYRLLDTPPVTPLTLGALVQQIAPASLAALQQACWYDGFEHLPVPTSEAIDQDWGRLCELARACLAANQTRLLGLRAMIVTERQLNTGIERYGSKGQFLSLASLQLVADIVDLCDAPVDVYCDRHGGRKHYLPVLLEAMPDAWFAEVRATPQRSTYRTATQPPLEIHFSVKGDSFPPTALASMLAKYLRERMMECLNAFWKRHLPEIKSTAGYPSDARRFRTEIEPTAHALGLTADSWWRCR